MRGLGRGQKRLSCGDSCTPLAWSAPQDGAPQDGGKGQRYEHDFDSLGFEGCTKGEPADPPKAIDAYQRQTRRGHDADDGGGGEG